MRRNQSPTTFVDSAKPGSLRSAQCPGSLQCPVTCPSRAPSASPPPVTTTTSTTHRPFTATAHTRTHATPSPPAPLASTLVLARFRPLVHTPRLAPPSALCSACPVISFALGAFISPAIPTSPHRTVYSRTASVQPPVRPGTLCDDNNATGDWNAHQHSATVNLA